MKYQSHLRLVSCFTIIIDPKGVSRPVNRNTINSSCTVHSGDKPFGPFTAPSHIDNMTSRTFDLVGYPYS